LGNLIDFALSEDIRKLATTAAGKAAGTVAGALIKNRLFSRGAKKELEGAFVSALAVAAEESRAGNDPGGQLHWWTEHGDSFFAPFEDANVAMVVSRCAMTGVDHSEISGLLRDAIRLSDLDPSRFGQDHDIDFNHFAEILPVRVIQAVVYSGSNPSSKLASQAQLAQLTKLVATLSGGTVAPLSPREARSQLAAWCRSEADRHRRALAQLPYLAGHPNPTAPNITGHTRLGIRKDTSIAVGANPYALAADIDDGRTVEMPYLQAADQYAQLVILADAGMGKTWLLHHHAINMALAAADILDRAGTPLADVPLPILLRADTLAEAHHDGESLAAAAVRALEAAGSRIPQRMHTQIIKHCENGPATYLIDALDETTPAQHSTLVELLTPPTNKHARYILTCRISAYRDLLDPASRELAELLPFTDPAPYIDSWELPHPSQTELLRRMEHAAVGQMARVPLLLAFLCHLAKDPDQHLPNTRAELYERIIRRFLSAEHRPQHPRTKVAESSPLSGDPNARADELLDILQPLTFKIATASSGWLDTIPRKTLLTYLREVSLPQNLTPPAALAVLTNDVGILAAQAPLRAGATPNYRYVHRTIAEFLTAAHVAEDPDRITQCAKEHLHFAYDWRETWRLTAQLDPETTLRVLAEHTTDPLYIALTTAAEAIQDLAPDQSEQAAAHIDTHRNDAIGLLNKPKAAPEVRQVAAYALGRIGGTKAVTALTNALQTSADITWRRWNAPSPASAALEALSQTGRPENIAAIPVLRQMIESAIEVGKHQNQPPLSDEQIVLRGAITTLGRIGGPEAVAALIEVIRHPEARGSTVAKAVRALGVIGSPDADSAIPDIAALTLDPSVRGSQHFQLPSNLQPLDWDDRREVARATSEQLRLINSQRFVEEFMEVLGNEAKSVQERDAAATALGCVATPTDIAVVEKLLAIVNDQDTATDLRNSASVALGSIGGSSIAAALTQVLADALTDSDTFSYTAEGLRILGAPDALLAVPTLARAFQEQHDLAIQRAALRALRHIGGSDAVALIGGLLNDPQVNPLIHEEAASALGSIGESDASAAIRALTGALGHNERNTRLNAALSLGYVHSPEATPAHIRALENEALDVEVRRQIVHALGGAKADRAEAIPALIRATKDHNDDQVRAEAIDSLRRIAGPEAALALTALLDSPNLDSTLSGLVLRALGEIGTTDGLSVVPVIVNLLKTDYREYKQLLKAGYPGYREYQGAAIAALAKLGGEEAVTALTDLLKDERTASDSRRSVVAALGEIGGPEAFSAVPALIRYIGGENRSLEAAAVYALGDIGGPDAIDALRSAVSNKSVSADTRIGAARSLGHLGDLWLLENLSVVDISQSDALAIAMAEGYETWLYTRTADDVVTYVMLAFNSGVPKLREMALHSSFQSLPTGTISPKLRTANLLEFFEMITRIADDA
jgi:HEAT repeat protein